MSSYFVCKLKQFVRKQEAVPKAVSDRIYNTMLDLSNKWDKGIGYRNVKEMGYNNYETFQWIYEKYTHKPFDVSEFPMNLKDLRKFQIGLHQYNKSLAKPAGAFAAKFHVPRETMKNFPELMKFEK